MANNSTTSTGSHGQGRSETSSRCVMEKVTGTHDFEVTDFSLLDSMGIGKFISSSTFSVGGRDWNIHLYPNGWTEEDEAAYVSIFLNLCGGPVDVMVKYSFSLLVGKYDQEGKLIEDGAHIFDCLGFWGSPKFVEKYKLTSLLQRSNDSFTVRCVVTVIEDPRTEDTSTIIAVPQSKLSQHFERMLKDGKGTDVTFSVDGRFFHAHRCVLAARSSVFEAELFGPMKNEPAQQIKIDDMEPSTFESLLHFMYTDSLPRNCEVSDITTMRRLLVAADRYGLDRLTLMCEAKLCDGIDVPTVATTLALAARHHCVQLKDACLRYIASGDALGAVMGTDGFKDLKTSRPSIIMEILDKVAVVRNTR